MLEDVKPSSMHRVDVSQLFAACAASKYSRSMHSMKVPFDAGCGRARGRHDCHGRERTNVDGRGREVVDAVQARVDGKQEDDCYFVGEHEGGLGHMEAVPCEWRGRRRPETANSTVVPTPCRDPRRSRRSYATAQSSDTLCPLA